MIKTFLISLFLTLLVVRAGAYFLHDFKAYGKNGWRGKHKDKSRTFTGYLRRKTGIDIHHIHIGIIILLISLTWIGLKGVSSLLIVSLGIGISLVCDQIFPLLGFCNYFSRKGILLSLVLHLAVGGIVILA